MSPAARNALIRWINPWSKVERFTFANVEPLPARMVVPYAEPFNLQVHLRPGTQWSPAEGSGRILDQPPVKARLAAGIYPFTFPPQKKEVDLALSLGDVRKSIVIEPKTRPGAGGSQSACETAWLSRLPIGADRRGSRRLVQRLERLARRPLKRKAIRDIVSATMDGKDQKVDDGKIVTGYVPVDSDMERQFTWKDHDGLAPHEPLVLKVKAGEDEAPRIVARRDSLEEVVLDSEVVTFDLTATDDFGVKEVGLEWAGSLTQDDGKTPISGSKVVAAGGNEKRELDAARHFLRNA